MKRTIILSGPTQRARAIEDIRNAPEDMVVTIQPRNRTHEQNALMWGMLQDISEQIRPEDQYFSPEIWLDYFKKKFVGMDLIELPDGSVVEREVRSSKMDKKEFSYFVDQIQAWAIENGVRFVVNETS